ncbi:MAG: PQQ-binding-like beta-propeller repeat protein, partial [Streptomycetaceae bacterium]|nr:PQQ-binding-like beta-propeller repeat protein [Streptomycetaceae bacterium]
GGATGWLLTRDSGPKAGSTVWSLGIGLAPDTRAVAHQNTLFIAADGTDDKDSPNSGQLISIDRSTSKLNWRNPLGGPNVSEPVVAADGEHVFVHSWVKTDDSSAPGDYHDVVYAFDKAGIVSWSAEFDTFGLQIPETVDKVLVVAVAPPTDSSSDTGKGQVVGYDAATGEKKWTWPLPSEAPLPNVPVIVGDLVVLATITESSSDPGIVTALRTSDGSVAWQWRTGDDGWWLTAPAAANGRVFLRAAYTDGGEYYAKERTLTALSLTDVDGGTPKQLWHTPNLPAGYSHQLSVDAKSDTVFTLTEGNERYGTKTDPWVKAYDGARGALKWQFKPKGWYLSELVCDERLAYFAAWPSDEQARVVDPSASPTPTATPSGEPVMTGYVYAIDIVTGTVKWTHETGGHGAVTTPQLVKGVLCVGVSAGGPAHTSGKAIALDAEDGHELWTQDLQGQDVSGPIVAGDRFHLVASPDAKSREATGKGDATAYEFQP